MWLLGTPVLVAPLSSDRQDRQLQHLILHTGPCRTFGSSLSLTKSFNVLDGKLTKALFSLDLLEGDIILENTGSLRASVNQKIYLWPEGIVPYVFDSSLCE